MKATKNLLQTEKPRLTLAEMTLELPQGSEGWMNGDFENLVEFITRPNMDNAHTAASMAFNRLRGLTEAMTFETHSGKSEEDWGEPFS